jgi:O-antigen/teichoic acid export membrane protein
MNLKRLNELLKHEFAVLLGGSTFIYSIRLVGAGLTFLTQLLLLRWMGEIELGRFVFAFAIASVLAWISTLGIPVAATRFVPQAIAQGRRGLAKGFFLRAAEIVTVAALVCTALAAAVMLWVGWDASDDELATLLCGALLIPFLTAMMSQNDSGRALFLVTTSFLPNMLLRHVFLLAGVSVLYFSGVELNAARTMAVLLASVAVLAIGQFFFIRREIVKVVGDAKPEYDTKTWVAAGLPLVVAFGFTGFFLEINIALAGVFLPRGDLAVYNLAFQITNLIAFFLVAVGYQFGPHASRLYGEGQMNALQRLVTRTAHIRFVFAIGMFAGMAVLGAWILGIYSPKFEQGYWALLILCGTQVIAGITGPVAVLQNVFGLQRSAIIVSAIAIGVDLVATPILATEFGVEGAAIAVLLTMTVWNGLMLIAVIRNTAIEPSVFGLRSLFGPPHRAPLQSQVEADAATQRASNVNEPSLDEDGSRKTGTTD